MYQSRQSQQWLDPESPGASTGPPISRSPVASTTISSTAMSLSPNCLQQVNKRMVVHPEKAQNIIVAEMFIMFVLFWALQIYYFFIWGVAEQDEVGIASLPAPILGGPGKWNNIDLKRDFSIWFSAHVACTTMAILYAPYTFAIVIAWFHLGAFLILLVFIFIACAPFTLRLPWYFMAAFNIVLAIIGLVGAGRLPVI